MYPMANRIAGFGSHACIWIPSETLEPVFHHVFIWHLIGGGDSYLRNELSCPIMCQMKALMKSLMKTQLSLSQAQHASASEESCPGWVNQSIGVYTQKAKVDKVRRASAIEKRTL